MKKTILPFMIFALLAGCITNRIPTEKFSQLAFPTPKIDLENNQLNIALKNPVDCPLRVILGSQNEKLQAEFEKLNPIELSPKSDTLITVLNIAGFEKNLSFDYKWYLGSLAKKIQNIELELPFPKGKKYKVIQGNNTNFTHNTDWSRYAVDFDLKVNDTICAATSGVVVGVVDQYKYGGQGEQWKPFGNFITIYEPNSGIFTQYVHLTKEGSLVQVGDKIEQGQAIGLSGNTGQTNIEHLHFNCLIPVDNEDGLKSIPFEFIGGYKSEDLKKKDVMVK